MTAERASYQPIYELQRGNLVESIHYGSLAVVDVHGNLLVSFGNPKTVTFLRSSAKPFQALPFIEEGGHTHFGLNPSEIALLCASHSGTDEHVAQVRAIQAKTGVQEDQLQCGTHPVSHQPTAQALLLRGEQPTPNRHNCSGKHTGMLASALLNHLPTVSYLDNDHPLQQRILSTFAEMCKLDVDQVALGIDGCSAPNFAVSLYHAALAYARLSDPKACPDISQERAAACQIITQAMMTHPEMVGGPDSFDTDLMRVTKGRLICKGGAEGYQALGLQPDALASGSAGIGIALKISDGDFDGRARHAVTLTILAQLQVISPDELAQLSKYGPTSILYNWQQIAVGQARPLISLALRQASLET
jgi:L-asparaginase II